MSETKNIERTVIPPLIKKSGRAVKHSPKALAVEEQRPKKKQKMNVLTSHSSSSSPSLSKKLPAQVENQPPPTPEQSPSPELSQLSQISPPLSKFWDINDSFPPIIPAIPEPSQAQASLTSVETLYFAYGKDMDATYLTRKLPHSNIKFIAVGKMLGFDWIIGKDCRFPKILKSKGAGEEVWGLIYQLSEEGLNFLRLKAEKRGLKIEEKKVSMLEKTGLPGFWNAPLEDIGVATVSVMIGDWEDGDGMEVGEVRKLEGSKRRKLNGGILWAASEGLPEGWKEVLRGWVGEVRGPEETGYWGSGVKCAGGEEVVEDVVRSQRLKGSGKAKGKGKGWK